MRRPLTIRSAGFLALFLGFLPFHIAATTYYVDINSPNPTPPYNSWGTASTDIQSAVNLTANGDLVLVNPGVYQSGGYTSPDGVPVAVLVTNAVTLEGVDGPSATSINGDGTMRGIYLESTSVLEGFTITNSTSGTNNGGGACCDTASQIVSNCVIVGNIAYGTDSQFSQGGGGIYGGTLYNCLIISNSSPNGNGGGGKFSIMNNCVLNGNTAANGGGEFQGEIINCTLVGNTASSSGGGMDNYDADSSTIENCIIYDNTCPNGANCYGGTYNYCCTTPLPGGTGNITNAPLFVDEAAGDFELQSNSPCINAGDNAYVTTTNDFAGNPRIVDDIVDMGAYEYQGLLPLILSIQTATTNVATGFPLQFQAVVDNGLASTTSWNFGDGSTAMNELSVSHSWSSPGIYNVTVTVSNNFVLQSTSASLEINVGQSTCYVNANGTDPVTPYSSWDTAATNIQDAINAMIYYGETILVTNGVYQSGGYTAPDGALSAVVVTNPVTVQSVNGPAFTFINGSNAMRGVYLQNGSVLAGFTITNGWTVNGRGDTNFNGGGIYGQSTACVVSHCVITGNAAGESGGGAYQGTLVDCTVLGNKAFENGGGAANAVIYQSLVISDMADDEGGGTYDCTNFNSAFADNYAKEEGGGAYGGSLVNCTITDNSAPYGGGTRNANLINSINYYNQSLEQTGGSNYFGGSFSYCCTTPLPSGTGNITSQPVLASISHISLNSPCVGAGNPAVTSGVDIDGNPWNNPPSIGCSEIYPGNNYGNLTVGISMPFINWPPGYPLSFQPNIAGPVYSNVWSWGDGTFITNQAYVSHTWSTTGVYTVTLTAYNDSYPAGVTATLPLTIAVPSVYYVNLNNGSGLSSGNPFLPYPNPVPPYITWGTAATNIQAAVNVAIPGSLVLVSNGVYNAGSQISSDGGTNRVAVTQPVTVQSVNGPAATIITGGNPIRCVYLTNGAVLDGFTLTNGNSSSAGGVYCTSTGAFVLNCLIANNISKSGVNYNAGGIYSGTVSNCTIAGNTGFGTWNSVLYDCLIASNILYGAYDSTLNNCILYTNQGGAYYSTLYNCIISNNAYGGLYGCQATGCKIVNNFDIEDGRAGGVTDSYLTNCIIAGNVNSFVQAGGVQFATLVNCLIVSNTGNLGGAFACNMENCIAYYNNPSNIYYPTLVNYCCTFPLPSGIGNITNAPLFVNAAAGNFQLQPNSPCINSGNNAYITIPTDLAGNPRIVGGTVDIGAFEYQTPTSVISYAWLQQYGLPTDGSVDYADLDGTAFNVYQDWVAGLNPTNPASILAMLTPIVTNSMSGALVSWQSVSGITYFLQRSTNLPAFTTLQSGITGQANTTSYMDASATNNIPYSYRVGVTAP